MEYADTKKLLHPQPKINVWRAAHGLPPLAGGHRTADELTAALRDVPLDVIWCGARWCDSPLAESS